MALIVWSTSGRSSSRTITGGYYQGTAGVVEIPLWPFMAAGPRSAPPRPAMQFLLAGGGRSSRAFGPGACAMSDIAIGALCLLGEPGADPDRHAHRRRADAPLVRRRLGDQGPRDRRQAPGELGRDLGRVRRLRASSRCSCSWDCSCRPPAWDATRSTSPRWCCDASAAGSASRPSRPTRCSPPAPARSIASASVFTKVAVPEMIRHGHTPKFSVGVVAGSSVLGMLIPPSILMIIFGVIANVSIGDLFTVGHPAGHPARRRLLRHHLAAGVLPPRAS